MTQFRELSTIATISKRRKSETRLVEVLWTGDGGREELEIAIIRDYTDIAEGKQFKTAMNFDIPSALMLKTALDTFFDSEK